MRFRAWSEWQMRQIKKRGRASKRSYTRRKLAVRKGGVKQKMLDRKEGKGVVVSFGTLNIKALLQIISCCLNKINSVFSCHKIQLNYC